jgi:hypothetical protein
MGNVYKDHVDSVIERQLNDMHARLKNAPLRTPAGGHDNRSSMGPVDRGVNPPQPPGGFPRIKSTRESVKKLHIPLPS